MRTRDYAVAAVAILCWGTGARAADLYGRVYDTLAGEVHKHIKVVLETQPPRETVTDDQGQYRFRDVAPGAYLVRIVLPEHRDVIGRLVVSPRLPITIANLDLSKIEAPGAHDEY